MQLGLYPLLSAGSASSRRPRDVLHPGVRGGPNAIITALCRSVLVATVLSALGLIPVTLAFDGDGLNFRNLYGSALIGLVVTFLLVAITEYYTATRWPR